MRPTIYLSSALLALCALSACSDDEDNDSPTTPVVPAPPIAQVVTGSGDITATVAQFRTVFRNDGSLFGALVAGFGAVFVDVDAAGPTTLEYFDKDGKSLSKVLVPVRAAGTPLSFAGARYADPIVARVRITLGNGSIGVGVKDVSAGGVNDIVVVDDFLYTEPQPLR